MNGRAKQTGFTIVELLIVVVVIAILAAVTIVSYTGIRDRATQSSVQTALSQANKKVLAYAATNSDMFPDTLAQAGVSDTGSVSYQYSSDNASTPRRYSVSASNGVAGPVQYYVTSAQPTATVGIAPGHNTIPWNKADDSTAPTPASSGVAIDTSVFKDSTASIRLGPSTTGRPLRNSPYTGAIGQTITVSLWIRTDSNWNGLSNNSKIRFGASGGGIIGACGYDGVKISWTLVTCTQTFTSTNPTMSVSVGNDGSTGNIWLDDISVRIQ